MLPYKFLAVLLYESYHHFDAMLSELVKALLSKHSVYKGVPNNV